MPPKHNSLEKLLSKVWEVQVLKKHNEIEAKELLDRVVKATAPLIARRGWQVKVLKEFFPNNPGLLGMNVNRGASILM